MRLVIDIGVMNITYVVYNDLKEIEYSTIEHTSESKDFILNVDFREIYTAMNDKITTLLVKYPGIEEVCIAIQSDDRIFSDKTLSRESIYGTLSKELILDEVETSIWNPYMFNGEMAVMTSSYLLEYEDMLLDLIITFQEKSDRRVKIYYTTKLNNLIQVGKTTSGKSAIVDFGASGTRVLMVQNGIPVAYKTFTNISARGIVQKLYMSDIDIGDAIDLLYDDKLLTYNLVSMYIQESMIDINHYLNNADSVLVMGGFVNKGITKFIKHKDVTEYRYLLSDDQFESEKLASINYDNIDITDTKNSKVFDLLEKIGYSKTLDLAYNTEIDVQEAINILLLEHQEKESVTNIKALKSSATADSLESINNIMDKIDKGIVDGIQGGSENSLGKLGPPDSINQSGQEADIALSKVNNEIDGLDRLSSENIDKNEIVRRRYSDEKEFLFNTNMNEDIIPIDQTVNKVDAIEDQVINLYNNSYIDADTPEFKLNKLMKIKEKLEAQILEDRDSVVSGESELHENFDHLKALNKELLELKELVEQDKLKNSMLYDTETDIFGNPISKTENTNEDGSEDFLTKRTADDDKILIINKELDRRYYNSIPTKQSTKWQKIALIASLALLITGVKAATDYGYVQEPSMKAIGSMDVKTADHVNTVFSIIENTANTFASVNNRKPPRIIKKVKNDEELKVMISFKQGEGSIGKLSATLSNNLGFVDYLISNTQLEQKEVEGTDTLLVTVTLRHPNEINQYLKDREEELKRKQKEDEANIKYIEKEIREKNKNK